MKMTFKEWLEKVDAILVVKCGMSHEDLPDCPYLSWYVGGRTPQSAANAAIKNAKE